MRHILVDCRAKFFHSYLPFPTKSDGGNGSRTVKKIEYEGLSVLCTSGEGESLSYRFSFGKNKCHFNDKLKFIERTTLIFFSPHWYTAADTKNGQNDRFDCIAMSLFNFNCVTTTKTNKTLQREHSLVKITSTNMVDSFATSHAPWSFAVVKHKNNNQMRATSHHHHHHCHITFYWDQSRKQCEWKIK